MTSRPVALVTGGSRGIGAAIASQAAGRGYDVVIAYRSRRDDAAAVASRVEAAGGCAHLVEADLSCRAGMEAVAGAAASAGPVTLVVNNAGITNSGPIDDLTWDQWQQALALNLTAPAWIARLLAPDLVRNRGAIVNVGSTGGIAGSVHSIPYGASKAGLIGLTKTLARMLAPDVRVNVVCPGIIETELLEGVTDEQRDGLIATTPAGRMGTAAEIARAVLDVSAWEYATGQTIVVDGGRVML